MVVFTICAKNYLAQARVLLKTLAQHNPSLHRILILADEIAGETNAQLEGAEIIEARTLGIPLFEQIAFFYDITEFNTAIKPFVFRWLFDQRKCTRAVYFDPDISVYSSLDLLDHLFTTGSSAVLTPHITEPIDDNKKPSELDILKAGTYNLGFLGLQDTTETRRFLDWWAERLKRFCVMDHEKGLFVDQKWCEFLPSFVSSVAILRNPGYNVAYWNLVHRTLTDVSGVWMVNGELLVFVHFSGANPRNRTDISRHQNRFSLSNVGPFARLFDDYLNSVEECGYERYRSLEYAYGHFANGDKVRRFYRRIYREHFDWAVSSTNNPFLLDGPSICNVAEQTLEPTKAGRVTRLIYHIWRERPDLRVVFPLSTEEGRAGLINWFKDHGIREYGFDKRFIQPLPLTRAANPAAVTEGVSGAGPDLTSSPEIRSTGATATIRCLVGALLATVSGLSKTVGGRLLRFSRKPVRCRSGGELALGLARKSSKFSHVTDVFVSQLMHMVWLDRPDVRKHYPLITSESRIGFVRWFRTEALREYGLGLEFLPDNRGRESVRASAVPTLAKPGANLIGYARAELGMGEHVRMTAVAFKAVGVPFGIHNYAAGCSSRQMDRTTDALLSEGNPHSVNLFHVNADQMLGAFTRLGVDFFADRYNIGYWAWELSHWPDDWRPAMTLVDEIWAPSRFIQRAIKPSTSQPVVYMPLCVSPVLNRSFAKADFTIPVNRFWFLYTFDSLSYIERKNPCGCIEAFRRAFPSGTEPVHLILKTMHGRDASVHWQKLEEAIGGDTRITIIDETMSRDRILGLISVSDCYVSLHRSEGFGRGPAESMYFGKPVLVTNYSGNVDFTRSDNSCPIDYQLVAVKQGQYPYPEGQVWAEPDLDQASWYMNRLSKDQTLCRQLGAKAELYMRTNHSPLAIGRKYAKRLRQLGLG
jgi:glycosyltransferase involved in cell wall biosynthesis